jgi:Endodeoxyribonuclease RusA
MGSGGKTLFKAAVRDAALKLIPKPPQYQGAQNLYARVIWFHAQPTTQDIDNIAKRLFDALDGTVYASDLQIVKCALEKVYYTNDAYELAGTAIANDVFQQLVEYLGQRAKDVLYVEIGTVPLRRVVFGPIDGVAR